MVTKKQGAAHGAGLSAGKVDGDSFDNPRFDEILTLLSRSQQTVIDRTIVSKKGAGQPVVQGAAQWQVPLQAVEERGYADTRRKDVGHADLVIEYMLGNSERRMMLICRPKLQSASATLKLMNTLSTRANINRMGSDHGHRDEEWGVATDNPHLRDVFEGNGYKYVCTQWNDIDGWGRTSKAPIKKVWSEEDAGTSSEQWVVIESDCSGVSTARVTTSILDAVAAFAQMMYLFAYAFPENEFVVCGSDDDAALEGIRLLMGVKLDAQDPKSEANWQAVCQVCKAMQTSTDVELAKPLMDIADMPFEVMEVALTRVLKGRGAKLDETEAGRLQHSWPALMYYRDLAELMSDEVKRREGRGAKLKGGKLLSDELWDAIAKVRSSTMTEVVIRESEE